jgi:hypothetical protein
MIDDWQRVIERTKQIQSRMSSLMNKFANISEDYKYDKQASNVYEDNNDILAGQYQTNCASTS